MRTEGNAGGNARILKRNTIIYKPSLCASVPSPSKPQLWYHWCSWAAPAISRWLSSRSWRRGAPMSKLAPPYAVWTDNRSVVVYSLCSVCDRDHVCRGQSQNRAL